MNNYIVILYLFRYYFYCSSFIIFVFYVISLVCYFFFEIFTIYVLNTAEYMNRQQQPDKMDMLRDAKADLGLRCPHMQKQSFSYDMALS